MSWNRCIVSAGVGGWFPLGVRRLDDSLRSVGWRGGFLAWRDSYPPGSPTHEHVSRGFKSWCVTAALKAGYDSVLWLDASVVAVADPAPIFDRLENVGYLLVESGNHVGEYSSDACLDIFGVPRMLARTIREVATGYVGVHCASHEAHRFLNDWRNYTLISDGAAYNGDKRNERCQASVDRDVKGHRHDQTVASLVAHRQALTRLVSPDEWGLITASLVVDVPRGGDWAARRFQ